MPAVPAVPESPAKREAWSDRWLLEFFRDRSNLPVQSESSALTAWEALENSGVTTETIIGIVQDISGAKIVDVSKLGAEQRSLLLPALAERYDVVPITLSGRTLEVATANPLGKNCERDLAFACGKRVLVRIAPPAAIRTARERVYGEHALPSSGSRITWITPDAVVSPSAAPTRGIAVDLLDRLILDALDQRASDLHLEPSDGELVVRYRIDGVLHETSRVSAALAPLLLSKLKVGAGLDIANRLRPQDGRSSLIIDGRPIDLRISTLPLGDRVEKAVIRILDAAGTALTFEALGFDASEIQQLTHILKGNEGMVLVTGPTGSGKTTTLYTALQHMRSGETNIVTVEDPIEYRLEGINQVQVNERAGLTFASALRSILRQDPDVVLVGEVRDIETAAIAIRASMTGHMVLSTLHTNDASSAIGRLADMGVDISALSSALKAVIAQRLVRRLCTECSVPLRVEDLPNELCWTLKDRDASQLRGPMGCAACRGTGYRGRMSIAEIFIIDEETQQLMGRSTQRLEFLQLARKHGMHTLWETGLERVLKGLTSFAELADNVTPPLPDAEMEQDEIDRMLSDIIASKSASGGPDASAIAATPSASTTVATRAFAGISPSTDDSLFPAPVRSRRGDAYHLTPIVPRRASDSRPRVLIVYEDQLQRRALRQALLRTGCAVLEASNGDSALAFACRLRPDAVITDVAMPGIDGLALLQALLVEAIVDKVFIYTHQKDQSLLEWAIELGARDAITTEEDPDTVAMVVHADLCATAPSAIIARGTEAASSQLC